jgi:hypothetical protein
MFYFGLATIAGRTRPKGIAPADVISRTATSRAAITFNSIRFGSPGRMGRFYNASINGRFDCRSDRLPV